MPWQLPCSRIHNAAGARDQFYLPVGEGGEAITTTQLLTNTYRLKRASLAFYYVDQTTHNTPLDYFFTGSFVQCIGYHHSPYGAPKHNPCFI
jgi:hypothetical protein